MRQRRQRLPPAKRRRITKDGDETDFGEIVLSHHLGLHRQNPKTNDPTPYANEWNIQQSEEQNSVHCLRFNLEFYRNTFEKPAFMQPMFSSTPDDSLSSDVSYTECIDELPELRHACVGTDESFKNYINDNYGNRESLVGSDNGSFIDDENLENIHICPDLLTDIPLEGEVNGNTDIPDANMNILKTDCDPVRPEVLTIQDEIENTKKLKTKMSKRRLRLKKLRSLFCCLSV